MLFIILIAISLILLGGFLLLVSFERGRGLRIMGAWRNALDRKIGRAAFIAAHVDWGAFVRHLASTFTERVLHDVAHVVLRLVRSVERLLTRAVKSLRERRGMMVPEEEGKVGAFQAGLLRVRAALRNARAASRKPARKARPHEDGN
jgi:hypothetical protein